MTYQHLILQHDGPVARIILNRPDVHNAFNDTLVGEIRDAFREVATDDSVRVVVLTGAGISFCAGADLGWLQRAVDYTVEENLADASRLVEMLNAIDLCPKPVVARVNGAALAGGTGLVACSDIAIALETARFGFTESRLGLVPATISPYVVRKIGESHARALFLTAERFEAARAVAIGLVHQAVSAEELDAAVERTVRNLLAGGPIALAENKALLRDIRARSGDELGRYTAETIARLRTSVEGQEGLRAFLEKRGTSWASRDA
jgi:methylglutaconyl-CoA hydratase